MPKQREFVAFLAESNFTEVEAAVSVIWFLSLSGDRNIGVTLSEIVDFLDVNRIRTNVNRSRLGKALLTHSSVVRGLAQGAFRIKASSDKALAKRFAEFADPQRELAPDHLISDGLALGNRRHLEHIRREANGCYDRAFYNGAAVMCRRLVELLLVESFDKAGHLAAITDTNGMIKQFGEIIRMAKSQQYIRLSRNTPETIEKVKLIGDAAAHHRFHMTTKRDLDDLNPQLRQALSELAGLAGYQ